jgi:hypothetical protein
MDPDGLTEYGRCIEDAAILRRLAGELAAVSKRHRRALRKMELGFTGMQVIDAAQALDGEAAQLTREGS